MVVFEATKSGKKSATFTEYFGEPPIFNSGTLFECANPPREDGYPRVNEIVAEVIFKSNPKDPNFDNPISDLEKKY